MTVTARGFAAPLREALDVLEAARIRVWRRLPYFTVMLFRLKPVERPGIDMAVDDGLRLYYDRTKILAWGIEYTPTFLAHEVQHVVRQHSKRAKALEPALLARYGRVASILRRTKGIVSWQNFCNWCGDFEINDALGRDWQWPPDFNPLRPENHGLPRDLSMEDYALRMVEAAERQAQEEKRDEQQQADDGDGSGQDDADGTADDDHEPDAHAGGESEGESNPRQEDRGAEEEPGEARDGDGAQEEGDPEEAGADAHDPDPDGENADRSGEGDAGDPADDQQADDADAPGAGDTDEGDDGDAGDSGSEPRAGAAAIGCCGSCAGNPIPGEGVGEDIPEATTPEQREVLDRRVAEAVVAWSKSNSRGITPGSWLLGWAQAQFAPPKLDPYKVLARAIRGVVADARRRVDYRVGPPSHKREVLRRMPQWGRRAPLMPVLQGPVPRVMVLVDTSGSMGRGQGSPLEKAARETFGLLRIAGGDLFGMAVDSQVQAVRPLRRLQDVLDLLQGGGGTDMAAGVRAVAEQDPPPDVVVLLTDGICCGWPQAHEMPPHCGFVAVVVNDSETYWQQVPAHLRRDAVWLRD